MEFEPIDSFTGEYRFLSNFHPSRVFYNGQVFPTVEHAYQAAKAVNHDDFLLFTDPILTAGQAKRLGRKIQLKPDWELIKISVMSDLIKQKFNNIILRKYLNETKGRELIEGNTWGDTFWGVCQGKGSNMLGKILMFERDFYNIETLFERSV